MASNDRPATDPVGLFHALHQAPYQFDYFQALRRLECACPDRPRLGESSHAKEEPIRLGQDPTLAFAPSTLASFSFGKNQQPPRLGVYFFGLFGPNGPLPLHLTEYVYDRLHNARDPTLARFCDLFHHRLLSLFFRAWANSQPAVSFDRPDQDRFAGYVASLFGIGASPLRDRDAMPDLAKLYYAGRLACQTRHAEGLQSVLQDFFQLPVRIDEFVGDWIDLPGDSRCRLGLSRDTSMLGATVILGERIWQAQQKFRIVLGAIDFNDYQRMLPGGNSLKRLMAVVRNYIGDELDWELNLILEQPEVPPLRLNSESRLGWTSWLTQGPLGRDGNDLVLHPYEIRGFRS